MLKRLFKRWVTEAITEYAPAHRRLSEQCEVISIKCEVGDAEADINRLTEKVERLSFQLHQINRQFKDMSDNLATATPGE